MAATWSSRACCEDLWSPPPAAKGPTTCRDLCGDRIKPHLPAADLFIVTYTADEIRDDIQLLRCILEMSVAVCIDLHKGSAVFVNDTEGT